MENARVIIYADVHLVLRVIIVKLEEDHHKDQHVQSHVEMVRVNKTIPVYVIKAGLVNCAIEIKYGLEI